MGAEPGEGCAVDAPGVGAGDAEFSGNVGLLPIEDVDGGDHGALPAGEDGVGGADGVAFVGVPFAAFDQFIEGVKVDALAPAEDLPLEVEHAAREVGEDTGWEAAFRRVMGANEIPEGVLGEGEAGIFIEQGVVADGVLAGLVAGEGQPLDGGLGGVYHCVASFALGAFVFVITVRKLTITFWCGPRPCCFST